MSVKPNPSVLVARVRSSTGILGLPIVLPHTVRELTDALADALDQNDTLAAELIAEEDRDKEFRRRAVAELRRIYTEVPDLVKRTAGRSCAMGISVGMLSGAGTIVGLDVLGSPPWAYAAPFIAGIAWALFAWLRFETSHLEAPEVQG